MKRMQQTLIAIMTAMVLCQGEIASAQTPGSSKPLRIIVPFGPGSVGDVTGRVIGEALFKRTGVPAIIDSRPGAGSLIAMQLVSRAEPDGNIIVLNSNAATVLQIVSANASFDIRRDLEPIVHAFQGTQGILVSNALPVNSVAELIAYAKQRPGVLNYGSSGIGSAVHMNTELFKLTAGIDMAHIPFNGGPPQLNALAANEVQVLVFDSGSAKALLDAGRIRMLAVTTLQRSPIFPNVPTVSEGALPGFETAFWYGFLTTPKTPRPVLNKLNADLNAVLQESTTKEKLLQIGYTPVGSTPEQFRKKIADEVEAWMKVAISAKLEKQ